jgi:membrane protein implicated in regulation of membrane protease activity
MSGLTWIEILYWVCAIGGGTLFILRMIMVILGMGGAHDVSDVGGGHDIGDVGHTGDIHADVGHDASADTTSDHAQDADVSFKLASLQGLTAFFTIFGLVGLALVRLGWHALLTFLGASAAGLLAVWILGLLFSQMKRLHSEGTLDIKNAIGQTGSVYLTIPEGGSGQAQVTVQGSLRIIDAVARDKKKIPTGEGIRVVDITAGNMLVVEKLE